MAATHTGSKSHSCQTCGTPEAHQVCSRCKTQHYCNRECQLKAWKAGHRQACVPASSAVGPQKAVAPWTTAVAPRDILADDVLWRAHEASSELCALQQGDKYAQALWTIATADEPSVASDKVAEQPLVRLVRGEMRRYKTWKALEQDWSHRHGVFHKIAWFSVRLLGVDICLELVRTRENQIWSRRLMALPKMPINRRDTDLFSRHALRVSAQCIGFSAGDWLRSQQCKWWNEAETKAWCERLDRTLDLSHELSLQYLRLSFVENHGLFAAAKGGQEAATAQKMDCNAMWPEDCKEPPVHALVAQEYASAKFGPLTLQPHSPELAAAFAVEQMSHGLEIPQATVYAGGNVGSDSARPILELPLDKCVELMRCTLDIHAEVTMPHQLFCLLFWHSHPAAATLKITDVRLA